MSAPRSLSSVLIETLTYGGDALGRLNGKALFIPYGAPGDRAQIAIREDHHTYARGEIVALDAPGPDRRQEPCTYAGRCGGCAWLHLHYPAQCAAKEALLREAMRGLPITSMTISPATGELGYRRRVRAQWKSRKSQVILGFFERRSSRIVNIKTCIALRPKLDRALRRMRKWLGNVRHGSGSLALVIGLDDALHAFVAADSGTLPNPAGLVGNGIMGVTLRYPSGEILNYQEREIVLRGGKTVVNEAENRDNQGPRIFGSAQAFAQANQEEDAHLAQIVGAHCDFPPSADVLELYAGNGNLSAVLAPKCRTLTAVERDPEALRLLAMAASSLHLGALRILALSAKAALESLVAEHKQFDTIVLDPPRSGAREIIDSLAACRARQIIYISCNPQTLARDLKALCALGYGRVSLHGIDMMPQTSHFEIVARLIRS